MEQLSFFVWLLSMASFNWIGLFVLVAMAMAIFVRDHKPSLVMLAVPFVWLTPLVLAGLFRETGDAKTADWLGFAALASLAVFAWCVFAVSRRMNVPDFLGAAWMITNGGVTLASAVVVGIASGGTWP